MGHASGYLAVKLLIRPAAPGRAGVEDSGRTSPHQRHSGQSEFESRPPSRRQPTTAAVDRLQQSHSQDSGVVSTRPGHPRGDHQPDAQVQAAKDRHTGYLDEHAGCWDVLGYAWSAVTSGSSWQRTASASVGPGPAAARVLRLQGARVGLAPRPARGRRPRRLLHQDGPRGHRQAPQGRPPPRRGTPRCSCSPTLSTPTKRPRWPAGGSGRPPPTADVSSHGPPAPATFAPWRASAAKPPTRKSPRRTRMQTPAWYSLRGLGPGCQNAGWSRERYSSPRTSDWTPSLSG